MQRVRESKAQSSRFSVPPLVVDTGNATVKAVMGAQQLRFQHSIAEITDAEYASILKSKSYQRGELIAVDGKYYVVGEGANAYRVIQRQRRAKYSRDYSGLLFLSAVARLFDSMPKDMPDYLRVIISHAPGDKEVNSIVKEAVLGRWDAQVGENHFRFNVRDVQTFSEPVGSYFKQAFVRNGRKWLTPLLGKTVGVLDIGGGTCSSLGVASNAKEIEAYAASGEQGVNTAIERLQKLLDSEHSNIFNKSAPSRNRMIDAIRNGGTYTAFGRPLDVKPLVKKALNPLLNEVMSLWHGRMLSGRDIDVLILTGGGSAILWDELVAALDFGVIIPAVPKEEMRYIEFANAQGASTFNEVSEG